MCCALSSTLQARWLETPDLIGSLSAASCETCTEPLSSRPNTDNRCPFAFAATQHHFRPQLPLPVMLAHLHLLARTPSRLYSPTPASMERASCSLSRPTQRTLYVFLPLCGLPPSSSDRPLALFHRSSLQKPCSGPSCSCSSTTHPPNTPSSSGSSLDHRPRPRLPALASHPAEPVVVTDS